MIAINRAALPPLTKEIEADSVQARRQAGRKPFRFTAWQALQRNWQLLLLTAVLLALFAPVITGLFINWYQDPDYSHGFFVPLVSGYLIWHKRSELVRMLPQPSLHGLLIVVGSIGLLFVGSLGAEFFLTRIACWGTFVGLIVYFFGWATLRAVSFPVMFLLLMIPLPALVYNEIVFPLQFVASAFATSVLDTIALFPVIREGNILVLPHNRIEVIEACSGIRSMMSLIALALAYGYFAERNRYIRMAMVLVVIPLAVVSNGFRVVGTALLTYYWGPKAADGFLHSFSGWVMFLVAAALLLMFHGVINYLRGLRTVPGNA